MTLNIEFVAECLRIDILDLFWLIRAKRKNTPCRYDPTYPEESTFLSSQMLSLQRGLTNYENFWQSLMREGEQPIEFMKRLTQALKSQKGYQKFLAERRAQSHNHKQYIRSGCI